MARLLLLLAVLLTLGCAPTLLDAREAVDAAARSYSAIEPGLRDQRTAEGDSCFLDMGPPGAPAVQTCLDEVRARWKPVRIAAETAHAIILSAQTSVGTAEAAAALGLRPNVARVFAVVLEAIRAAERLRDAMVELRKASVAPASSTGISNRRTSP